MRWVSYFLFRAPCDLPGLRFRSYVWIVVTADKHASKVSSNEYTSLFGFSLLTLDTASECASHISCPFVNPDLTRSLTSLKSLWLTTDFHLSTPIEHGVYRPYVFAAATFIKYPIRDINKHHPRISYKRGTLIGSLPTILLLTTLRYRGRLAAYHGIKSTVDVLFQWFTTFLWLLRSIDPITFVSRTRCLRIPIDLSVHFFLPIFFSVLSLM